MNTAPLYRSDVALNSDDLATCQKVLEALTVEVGVERDTEEWRRIGVIAIQLAQQGVRDENDLLLMVRTARGVLTTRDELALTPYGRGAVSFTERPDGAENPYPQDSVDAKAWEHGFLDAQKLASRDGSDSLHR